MFSFSLDEILWGLLKKLDKVVLNMSVQTLQPIIHRLLSCILRLLLSYRFTFLVPFEWEKQALAIDRPTHEYWTEAALLKMYFIFLEPLFEII